MMTYTLNFSQIGMDDLPRVGGKNASLGRLFRDFKPLGVGVLDGFATTADAYWRLLGENGLKDRLEKIFACFDPENLEELALRGHQARGAVLETSLPEELKQAIRAAHRDLVDRLGRDAELAVRSSATAEDLPEASFAGAAESFLNIRGIDALLRTVHQCYASLFTDRAIDGVPRLVEGQHGGQIHLTPLWVAEWRWKQANGQGYWPRPRGHDDHRACGSVSR